MLSKRYESTEVDRRTWLHVPSGTHWSTSSDTHQVVEIQIETSTKMYTPLSTVFNRSIVNFQFFMLCAWIGHIECESLTYVSRMVWEKKTSLKRPYDYLLYDYLF